MDLQLTEIKTKLQPVFEKYQDAILFCYCFGSYATNEANAKSDLDLAVYIKEDKLNFDFKLALLADICRGLKRNDVDLIILNELRNLILAEKIVRNGILFYETNRDVRQDFELKIIHRAIDFRTQRKEIIGI